MGQAARDPVQLHHDLGGRCTARPDFRPLPSELRCRVGLSTHVPDRVAEGFWRLKFALTVRPCEPTAHTFLQGANHVQPIPAGPQEHNGFTLTEMLIVIVILGVLSGIVVFAVSAFNNDGVTASCKADVKTVEIASEAYYAKATKYATAIDDEKHPRPRSWVPAT